MLREGVGNTLLHIGWAWECTRIDVSPAGSESLRWLQRFDGEGVLVEGGHQVWLAGDAG